VTEFTTKNVFDKKPAIGYGFDVSFFSHLHHHHHAHRVTAGVYF